MQMHNEYNKWMNEWQDKRPDTPTPSVRPSAHSTILQSESGWVRGRVDSLQALRKVMRNDYIIVASDSDRISIFNQQQLRVSFVTPFFAA